MRPIAALFVLGMLAPNGISAATDQTKLAKAKIHKLPDDQNAPVVVLDYRGGRLRRTSDQPLMVIRADGSIELGNPWGRTREIRGSMSAAELQALLQFIILHNSFFSTDAAIIKEAIREEVVAQGQGIPRVLDYTTISVRVLADGKDHAVSYYALSFYARRFPEIPELQQFHAIETRLNELATIVRAGGKQAVQDYLNQANKELKRQFPKQQPFKVSDLQFCNLSTDGSRRIRFYRFEKNEADKGQSYASVQIDVSAGGQTEFQVDAK